MNAGSMKKQPSGQPSSSPARHNIHRKAFHPDLLISALTVVVLMIFILTGCKNDMQEIRSLDFTDTLPDLTARDVKMYYSESAKVQVELISPLVLSYEGSEPYSEFPEGFVVLFYDSLQQVKSRISADYGINYEKKQLMEARHNVVVVNLEKDEQLNTEELFWDQKKQLIYTEKFVRITRGEEVIMGDGLTSDQEFESIEIVKPRGSIEVEDDG